MWLLQIPDWVTNLIASIIAVLAFIQPVVDAIVLFMLPILQPMGNVMRDFIILVLNQITVGNYTWFIVITAITAVTAITLAIIFPGYKDEKKK
jgi:hypothetical protein